MGNNGVIGKMGFLRVCIKIQKKLTQHSENAHQKYMSRHRLYRLVGILGRYKSQEFSLFNHFIKIHTVSMMYQALLGTDVAMTSTLKAELNVPRDLVGARSDR